MSYKVNFHEDAKRDLDSMDGRVKKLVLKQIVKIKDNPYLGVILGNIGGMDLTGYRKTYADNKKIRIVYKIIKEKVIVYIFAIGKREKEEVYKKALKRF